MLKIYLEIVVLTYDTSENNLDLRGKLLELF